MVIKKGRNITLSYCDFINNRAVLDVGGLKVEASSYINIS